MSRGTTRPLWALFAGAVAALGVSVDQGAAAGVETLNGKDTGYRGVWYANQPSGDQYVFKYSGGLGTYCAKHQPFAVYRPEVEKTFFCYGGATADDNQRLMHMVTYFDHKTKTVPRPTILLDKQTNDAHDNPVISVDDEGYLWVFSTSHGRGRPSFIHRSREPYSVDAFDRVAATRATAEGRKAIDNFSYMQVWRAPGRGFVSFFTRYHDPADRTSMFMSSPDGVQWSAWRRLAAIEEGHYQISAIGRDRTGAAFNFHPKRKGLNYRTNLYYLETPDFGHTWRTAAGAELDVPLTEVANAALVCNYQRESLNVYLKDIVYDADDRPIILYLTSKGYEAGPDNGPRTWRTARWTGETWEIRDAFTSDNNYDMGSLWIGGGDEWRIIAPALPGPQPYNPGGEVGMWVSEDRGQTWRLKKRLTANSSRNHTYVRRPVNAHDDFFAFWADGHGRKSSISQLYFADRDGTVYALPREMDAATVAPRLVAIAASQDAEEDGPSATHSTMGNESDESPGDGFTYFGKLRPRHARTIAASNWSVGAETMDRDFTIYANWRKYLGPLGVKKARIQSGWAKTEKNRGAYDWAWLDEIIPDMAAQGVEPWVCLCYGNPIYPGGGDTGLGGGLVSSEGALAAWERYVDAFVARYGKHVDEWEVWNEPRTGRGRGAIDYADFVIRTARVIRRRQPKAEIMFAAGGSFDPQFAKEVLVRLRKQGDLDLVNTIIYHPYEPNPDDSYGAVIALREMARSFAPHIDIRQGENGCPSQRGSFGALANHDWTQRSQAKWALRRLLGDLGHDIPSSYFSICDMTYPTRRNYKGLLAINDDKTVRGPKLAYGAVQHLTAVFDSSIERISNFQAKVSGAAEGAEFAAFGYEGPSGGTIATVWRSDAVPHDRLEIEWVTLTVRHRQFEQPVWIDLLSGHAYEMNPRLYRATDQGTTFEKLPVHDWPVVIAERREIDRLVTRPGAADGDQ